MFQASSSDEKQIWLVGYAAIAKVARVQTVQSIKYGVSSSLVLGGIASQNQLLSCIDSLRYIHAGESCACRVNSDNRSPR
jgi:hypothetical protein